MTGQDAADRLDRISQQGLCIGCGLCQEIAGPDRVRVTLTPNGYERPVILGDVDHTVVDRILDVCPGVRVTGMPSSQAADGRVDSVWGPWRRLVMAWAADAHVRHIGSTGGALTALGVHLLESGKVDAILHARASATEPGFGEAHISRTADDVIDAAGSRYGPTAVFTRLEEALSSGERLAIIAKPCDLSALRLFARHDPRIDRQVGFWLTMVCGGIMAPEGLAERMASFDIDPAALTGIRYRGHGCPGRTRFELLEEDSVEITYLDFWGDDESKWTVPYRCKICPDGSGEAADIAAADVWPGGTPTEEMLTYDPGRNVVIARTTVGEQLLADAVASGHLTTGDDATIEDLNSWQPHHVRKKLSSWARQMGRRRAGAIPIEIEGLRSEELARTQPVGALLEQARGSVERVRDGRADEPVPQAATPGSL